MDPAEKRGVDDVVSQWWVTKASKCALERELTRAVVPRSLDRVFGSVVEVVLLEVDVDDRGVDLECFGNSLAALGAQLVDPDSAK